MTYQDMTRETAIGLLKAMGQHALALRQTLEIYETYITENYFVYDCCGTTYECADCGAYIRKEDGEHGYTLYTRKDQPHREGCAVLIAMKSRAWEVIDE